MCGVTKVAETAYINFLYCNTKLKFYISEKTIMVGFRWLIKSASRYITPGYDASGVLRVQKFTCPKVVSNMTLGVRVFVHFDPL